MTSFVYAVRSRLGGVLYRFATVDISHCDNKVALHAALTSVLYKQGVGKRVLSMFSPDVLIPPGTLSKWPFHWTWKTNSGNVPVLVKEPKWMKIVFTCSTTGEMMSMLVHWVELRVVGHTVPVGTKR